MEIDWRRRSIEMHRRAQMAEGRLRKMEEQFSNSAGYAIREDKEDFGQKRCFMLGWMLLHEKLYRPLFVKQYRESLK